MWLFLKNNGSPEGGGGETGTALQETIGPLLRRHLVSNLRRTRKDLACEVVGIFTYKTN